MTAGAQTAVTHARPKATQACRCFAVVVVVTIGGCYGPVPDQSQFAPLGSLADGGLAVVRLYAAPIHPIELIATHPWFVVKRADETTFDRWEVQPWAREPYGHVLLNDRSATEDLDPDAYVVAELIGEQAEAVIDFIEMQSPHYPCQDTYVLVPGPNSNSYAQWVLDNTGWAVALPCTAIGKDVPADC
ncbi:MAG: DUF3750 domain-containing protein [Phycisphaerae bacterium]|nr:DUF3750 domain-containing protein [Phycisphaerae bacterium]